MRGSFGPFSLSSHTTTFFCLTSSLRKVLELGIFGEIGDSIMNYNSCDRIVLDTGGWFFGMGALEEDNGAHDGSSANQARHLEGGGGTRGGGCWATSGGGGGGAIAGELCLLARVPGGLGLELGAVQILLLNRALRKAWAGLAHVVGVFGGAAVVAKSQRSHEVGVGGVLGELAGEHLVADILCSHRKRSKPKWMLADE